MKNKTKFYIYGIAKKCLMLLLLTINFVLFEACKQPYEIASDKKLLDIDSLNIANWELIPSKKDEGNKYKVGLHNNLWMIMLPESAPAEADAGYLTRSFRHLQNMKAIKQLNVKKESWDTMGIADNGTRLVLTDKKGKTQSLILGNMFFYQNKTAYYVRPVDDEKVYVVQQYLDGSIKAQADKFRKKELVLAVPAQMGDILFLNPGGIDFMLKKAGQLNWEIDGILTNDSNTINYLQKLSSLQIKNFGSQPATGVELSIEIKLMDGTSTWLKASRKNSEKWIISSSANQGNFMELNSTEISVLFPPKSYFTQPQKK